MSTFSTSRTSLFQTRIVSPTVGTAVTLTQTAAPTLGNVSNGVFIIHPTEMENTPASAVLATLRATDPNGKSLRYSLSGADAQTFVIDPVTGVLRFASSPDFENAHGPHYQINVIATNSTGLTASAALGIDITNAPRLALTHANLAQAAAADAPWEEVDVMESGLNLSALPLPHLREITLGQNVSATLSVDQANTMLKAASGTNTVTLTGSGTLLHTAADVETYVLTDGVDFHAWQDQARAGKSVQLADGAAATITLDSQQLTPGSGSAMEIGGLSAAARVNLDGITPGSTLILHAGATAAADLHDVSANGALAPLLGYAANSFQDGIHAVLIDQPGSTAGRTNAGVYLVDVRNHVAASVEMLAMLSDVDPTALPQVFSSPQPASLPIVLRDATDGVFTIHPTEVENTPAATVLATLTVTDPNGTPPSYTLGGADAAAFVIDPASGALRFASAPDFESPHGPHYQLSVTAADATGQSTSASLGVDVTDACLILTSANLAQAAAPDAPWEDVDVEESGLDLSSLPLPCLHTITLGQDVSTTMRIDQADSKLRAAPGTNTVTLTGVDNLLHTPADVETYVLAPPHVWYAMQQIFVHPGTNVISQADFSARIYIAVESRSAHGTWTGLDASDTVEIWNGDISGVNGGHATGAGHASLAYAEVMTGEQLLGFTDIDVPDWDSSVLTVKGAVDGTVAAGARRLQLDDVPGNHLTLSDTAQTVFTAGGQNAVLIDTGSLASFDVGQLHLQAGADTLIVSQDGINLSGVSTAEIIDLARVANVSMSAATLASAQIVGDGIQQVTITDHLAPVVASAAVESYVLTDGVDFQAWQEQDRAGKSVQLANGAAATITIGGNTVTPGGDRAFDILGLSAADHVHLGAAAPGSIAFVHARASSGIDLHGVVALSALIADAANSSGPDGMHAVVLDQAGAGMADAGVYLVDVVDHATAGVELVAVLKNVDPGSLAQIFS